VDAAAAAPTADAALRTSPPALDQWLLRCSITTMETLTISTATSKPLLITAALHGREENMILDDQPADFKRNATAHGAVIQRARNRGFQPPPD
jgi:hypothetical protein